jgi:tRNA/rRNA methyltransferase
VGVVLDRPQKSENIGSAARAMANTGLSRLTLVSPRITKFPLMISAATRQGEPVLRGAIFADSLEAALAPFSLVVGATARLGARRGKALPPREAAPLILAHAPGRCALLFGTEREGLGSKELRLCHQIVTIPSESPQCSSLNLAQAVLIMGYELLLAAGGGPPPPQPIKAAPLEDFERACADLESALTQIGFLPPSNPGLWFMNLKKVFHRSLLTRGECDLLQGIARQIRWSAGVGRKPREGGPSGAGEAAKAANGAESGAGEDGAAQKGAESGAGEDEKEAKSGDGEDLAEGKGAGNADPEGQGT